MSASQDTNPAETCACRLALLRDVTHEKSLQLRVIVGKGNHSSAGEASLPRVVESHLMGSHINYSMRPGVITVNLVGLGR